MLTYERRHTTATTDKIRKSPSEKHDKRKEFSIKIYKLNRKYVNIINNVNKDENGVRYISISFLQKRVRICPLWFSSLFD